MEGPAEVLGVTVPDENVVAEAAIQCVVEAASFQLIDAVSTVQIVAAMVHRRRRLGFGIVTPKLVVADPAVQLVVPALARELVVAGASVQDVVAVLRSGHGFHIAEQVEAVAVNPVVARVPEQHVVAGQAHDVVLVVSAVHHIAARAGTDPVVTRAAVDQAGGVAAQRAQASAADDAVGLDAIGINAAVVGHPAQSARVLGAGGHRGCIGGAQRVVQSACGRAVDEVPPGSAVEGVLPHAAEQQVVSVAAFDDIVARSTEQRVVAAQALYLVGQAAAGDDVLGVGLEQVAVLHVVVVEVGVVGVGDSLLEVAAVAGGGDGRLVLQ